MGSVIPMTTTAVPFCYNVQEVTGHGSASWVSNMHNHSLVACLHICDFHIRDGILLDKGYLIIVL
jgi:hypothetical protein